MPILLTGPRKRTFESPRAVGWGGCIRVRAAAGVREEVKGDVPLACEKGRAEGRTEGRPATGGTGGEALTCDEGVLAVGGLKV